MGFRRSDLQEAFFVPGAHAFRVWGYGTTDPLEEVLAPSYFRVAGELRPGELIYVSKTPLPLRGGGPEDGEARLALVMVRRDERGAPSVRLVQDFGGPNDPPGSPVPIKRGRGRPPGSRNKKSA